MINLDHNATTPLLPEVLQAMLPFLQNAGNPASAHAHGRAAAMAVDRARQAVADLAGWPRDGVVFCSGATEANGLALGGARWAVNAVEHPSVLAWGAETLPVDASGQIRLDVLEQYLAKTLDIVGISVQYANNETGVIQPFREAARLAKSRGLLVHVDAAQAPGRAPLTELGDVDFISLSAHKMGGPQGVGALLVRPGLPPRPALRGGPQERGWRAGTHNVAGIVGFGEAARIAQHTVQRVELRDLLESTAVSLGGRVAGAHAVRLWNTLSVGFTAIDASDLVVALDLEGVCASAGSACASGSPKPSHVLRAMCFEGSAVRFSLGQNTTMAEVEAAGGSLGRVLARMRKNE